ncbi:MAG TPA: ABC transporter permease [Vicinamibacterales bacterium]
MVREAWRGLAAYRMRASLSAAGIVVGVATVVAALAVAEGARRRAYDEASALGVDNAFLRSRPPAPGYPPAPRFRPADVDLLARELAGTQVAAARRVRGQVEYLAGASAVTIAGVTPRWLGIAGLEIAAGRWITGDDLAGQRRVIVLAPGLAATLGAGEPAVGSVIRWRDTWFTVVGILNPGRLADGQASAYVPLTVLDAPLGAADDGRGAQEIALRARAGDDVEAAAAAAARALTRRGHPAETFEAVVPRALLRARLESQRTFDWVLFGVGALALAVSGVGIMNIMLASVAERTAEIGVRRAAGARRRDVLAQFAAEAALLCAAGGVLGIPLGALFAAVIAAGAGWPVAIAPSAAALSLLLATAVGMAFGTYPARRAAMLDPVEALRG